MCSSPRGDALQRGVLWLGRVGCRQRGRWGGRSLPIPSSLTWLHYGQGERERRGLQGCHGLWEPAVGIKSRLHEHKGWRDDKFWASSPYSHLTPFSYSIIGCTNECKLRMLLLPSSFGWCSKRLNTVLGLGTQTPLLLKHLEKWNRANSYITSCWY